LESLIHEMNEGYEDFYRGMKVKVTLLWSTVASAGLKPQVATR